MPPASCADRSRWPRRPVPGQPARRRLVLGDRVLRDPAPPRRGRRRALVVLLLLCLLAAFTLEGPALAEGTPRWQWPLPPPHPVLHAFDAPDQPYGAGHRGIDIAVGGPGSEIRAVEAGTVHHSGPVAGRGVVSVRHADGLLSTYEPVHPEVAKGQSVAAGDLLGTIAPEAAAASHCSPQLCLHLGARRGEHYLDPELLLGARGPSVLLPWAGSASGGSATAARRASGAPESGPQPAAARTGTGTGVESEATGSGAMDPGSSEPGSWKPGATRSGSRTLAVLLD